MITRRGSFIRATVVFGALAAGALTWAYSAMQAQRGGGTVEVRQVPGRSWGVEIKELPMPMPSAASESRSDRVVAKGQDTSE